LKRLAPPEGSEPVFTDILENDSNFLLLLSQNHGLFIYDGSSLLPWSSDLESFGNENCQNLLPLPQKHFAISTRKNGVLIFTSLGKLIAQLGPNIDPELIEIRNISVNSYQQLWIQTPSSLFFFPSSLAYTKPVFPEAQLGQWCDIAELGNRYYFATAGYLFSATIDEHDILQPLKKLYPETFYKVNKVETAAKQLLVSTEQGLFSITDDAPPTLVFKHYKLSQIHCLKNRPNTVLASDADSLILLSYNGTQWKELQDPIITGHAVHSIVEGGNKQLWLELGAGKVGLVQQKQNNQFSFRLYTTKDGLPPDWVPIWEVDGKVFFTFRSKIYQYSAVSDSFVINDYYTSLLSPLDGVSRPFKDSENRFWAPARNGCYRLNNTQNSSGKPPLWEPQTQLSHFSVSSIHKDKDGGLWLISPDQPILYQAKLDFLKRPPFKTYITSISNGNHHQRFQGSILQKSFEEFEIIGNSFYADFLSVDPNSSHEVKHQFFLEGHSATWSEPQELNLLYLKKLAPGNYRLRVRALNDEGRISREASVQFAIKAPFFQSIHGNLLLLIPVPFLIFWLFFQLRNKQLKATEAQNVKTRLLNDEIKKLEDRLNASRKEASRAGEEKSRFFATMSHDLRTPLNGIIGMTSLLKEQSQNAEQEETVDLIWKSSQRLLNLIDNLVDFSRMDAHALELENTPFSLLEMLDQSFNKVEDLALKHGVDLCYMIEDDLPLTWVGDKNRIRKVLFNLIHNAVKFTPKGEVLVQVSQRIGENDETSLLFKVSDTGIGIRSSQKQILLHLFNNSEPHTSKRPKGTGLGLLISHKLVQLMNGKLGFDNDRQTGSSFFFEIPLQSREDPAWEEENRQHIQKLQQSKLLLIEDNPHISHSLQSWMKRWGVSLHTVQHSKDAIRLVHQQGSFDYILIDLQLKDCDPDQLGRSLRQAHVTKSPAFVGMGQASVNDHSLFEMGLPKPVSLDSIFKTLAESGTSPGRKSDPKDPTPTLNTTEAEEPPPMKLLVVDDNAINLQLARRMLEKLGYRADTAENGFQALEKCRHFKYDIIFMDIQMPELDGMETSKRIREMSEKKRNPWIVALTARVLKSDREEILAAGLDDFMPKPINLETMRTSLQRGWRKLNERK